jgi:hypothetical protein
MDYGAQLTQTAIGLAIVILSGAAARALEPVCWTRSAIVAFGHAYDAPNGNVIGFLGNEGRRLFVDHWQDGWALFTNRAEPTVGWVEQGNVKRRLDVLTCIPVTSLRVPEQQ